MQHQVNDDILLIYGKTMFKCTTLENILKRLVFVAMLKENQQRMRNNNENITLIWMRFNQQRTFTLGGITRFKELLSNPNICTNLTFTDFDIQEIKRIKNLRNKIAHNFNMIATYDLNDWNVSNKNREKTALFNDDCNYVLNNIDNLIGKYKEALNTIETEFEEEGIRFPYYDYEKN